MSYKIYDVTKTQINCDNYEVKINGQKVRLNTARVSAYPFNRRWPGHQRDIKQTELINFLSLETDEVLEFEIQPKEKFDNAIIRPVSLGIIPEITEEGIIKFALKKPAYFTVEPFGRKNALHIFADSIEKYDVQKNDENVLYFGKGEHDVGMINLKSNQTVVIDEGAVVYACIHAKEANNIRIIGKGILDNSRNKEQVLFEANEENNFAAVNNVVRLHTIQFEYCSNIEIDGITIRDSLVYNIRPIASSDINIKNVKIIGCWRYNSDGIDMHNCKNVVVDNCFIRTFDDSLCIKGFDYYYGEDAAKAANEAMYYKGKSYDVFKNVIVKNSVIWNDWGKCLEIGAETYGKEISNILFENISISHVIAYPLDCMNVDNADVHDIAYKNIFIEYDENIPQNIIQTSDSDEYKIKNPDCNPEVINLEIGFHAEYSTSKEKRGKNRWFLFENIRLYGRHKPKFMFRGYDEEHKVSDITIKDFYWNDKPIETEEYEIKMNEYCENIKII